MRIRREGIERGGVLALVGNGGRRVIGGWLVCGLLLVTWVCAACGEEQTATSVTQEPFDTSTAPGAADLAFAQVFVEMAEAAAPMPVYGFTELPEGAMIAVEWWPVVDLGDPAEYEGPPVGNPRVSGGEAAEPEIQLVLEYQGGWLVLLQNFRGDPGDVQGEQVGKVGGRPAVLYSVNEGTLVQWSDGGRWYGVFARGVPPDDVVRVALQMHSVSVADGVGTGAGGE